MKEFILIGIASFYILWLFYLAAMNLKRAKDNNTISNPALYLGYPAVILAYLLDVAFNWVFGTVMFLELPREGVLTHRLKRHYKKDNWRGRLARYICSNLLDAFDPSSKHCE